MYEEKRNPIPELSSDLEKALDSEPLLIDTSEQPTSFLDAAEAFAKKEEEKRRKIAVQDTLVIDPSTQESGRYEDHIRRNTQINITGKGKTERETDTRQFAIGKGERGEYSGPTSLQYIVKNLVEHHNTGLSEDDPEKINEGQYIQVIALGYKIGDERITFIGKDDSMVAESSIYQVSRHPDGYLWSEPAVGMSEVAGDLLQGHPLAKGLTKEQRSQAQIWIQLAHLPDKEVIKRVQLMNNGTGTPITSPEDTIGTLDQGFDEAAETRLADFFSEEKTPVQNPKSNEEPSKRLKRLSRKKFEF